MPLINLSIAFHKRGRQRFRCSALLGSACARLRNMAIPKRSDKLRQYELSMSERLSRGQSTTCRTKIISINASASLGNRHWSIPLLRTEPHI
jgi:hypothetical protein